MKKVLLSTVAIGALLLITNGAAYAASNVTAHDESTNRVKATQDLSSGISGSSVTENTLILSGDTDVKNRTGDINYDGTTTVAPGLFTLQNQTGLNNAGSNGFNLGVQVNEVGSPYSVSLTGHENSEESGPQNGVIADQTLNASIIDSNVTVNSYTNDEGGTLTRTGDINYDSNTFSGVGVYTLQNQTGMNNAGSNGTNIAAQLNMDSPAALHLDDGASNKVSASQSLTSSIDPSAVTITNDTDTNELGVAANRTGDINYSATTFSAPGLYTLQNNTGLNVASSNGFNMAVQMNGASDAIHLDEESSNAVLASQTMASTIASGTVLVSTHSDSDEPNLTGDVTYASTTFGAPGVFTLSNNTGMNNAASNGTNISAQLNGSPIFGL